jgi:hypothetical protein
VQALLDLPHSSTMTTADLRIWRAMAALERMNTLEAVAALKEFSEGLHDARLTIAAKDALARLSDAQGKR